METDNLTIAKLFLNFKKIQLIKVNFFDEKKIKFFDRNSG